MKIYTRDNAADQAAKGRKVMSEKQMSDSRCLHPACSPLGLCPGCGAVEAYGWVDGWHGWMCGSKNTAHHGRHVRFEQSTACAVSHWRIRAERAEARLRELNQANTEDATHENGDESKEGAVT